MRVRSLLPAVLGLLVCLSGAACAWRDSVGLRGNRAVVVYTRSRTADAAAARRILELEGMRVETQVAGPMSPTQSTLTVHDTYAFPERAERLRALLEARVGPLGLVSPGEQDDEATAAVLWLVD